MVQFHTRHSVPVHRSCSATPPALATTSVTPTGRQVDRPAVVVHCESIRHISSCLRCATVQEGGPCTSPRRPPGRAPEVAIISDRMKPECCDFSLPASRTARRSSRFSKVFPAGLAIDFDAITAELRRRQSGYGRGRRMAIESDRAEPLSGVRHGVTTGAPIALLIPNKDWENWQRTMHVGAREAGRRVAAPIAPPVTRPRPGHADLAGVVKYGHDDMRNVLERASARETAARVAVGAIARQLLRSVGTEIVSHVVVDRIACRRRSARDHASTRCGRFAADAPLHCVDADVEQQMIAEIDRAREAGDTMGGSFEVIAHGVPPGLGSYVQWDRKLDGRLAQALMSIPAIKARRHRTRSAVATYPGSRVHDEILPRPARRPRRSASRGRPTTPAASKAASPTARICASRPT